MNRERFLVKSYGDNIDGVKAGLKKLFELLGTYSSATIVVPMIGQVQNTMLPTVLGEKLSKKLIKVRVIILEGGKKISLCGQSTLKNFKNDDVYLDLWGSSSSIKSLEDMTYAKAIILTTWTPADSVDWESSNNVTVIYNDGKG